MLGAPGPVRLSTTFVREIGQHFSSVPSLGQEGPIDSAATVRRSNVGKLAPAAAVPWAITIGAYAGSRLDRQPSLPRLTATPRPETRPAKSGTTPVLGAKCAYL